MIRGFKYRFYPTTEQAEHLSKVFGHSRFVYNWMLAKRKTGRMTYAETDKRLTLLKKEFDWLNEVSAVPLQQTLRHQQRGFVNLAQKRAKFPTFKKKNGKQSVSFVRTAFTYRNGVLALAKLGPLKIAWSRKFQGEPSTVYISKTSAGRYYVSLQVDAPLKFHSMRTGKIGIDLGLTDFAVTSDGDRFKAPKPLVAALKQLKRAQQTLSRRKKGSKNRIKARIKVAKIHQKVADIRSDWLHKLSTRLVQDNQLIAVETLAVRNMIRNRSLARSISDAGWGEFVRQLEYKCKWYGRQFVKIGAFFPSSKLCGCCGQVLDSLSLDVRSWTCDCGAVHDRDINAAKNILAEGIRLIACGETVRPKSNPRRVSAKQELVAECA